jgi:divalent metal cation (Fe/Co/Zn/Cd) transporter
MVGLVAWHIFRENVPMLLDAAVLDPADVRAIGAGIDGVEGIHHVRSRGTKWAVELDLHLQVAGDMKVEDAHRLAGQVEKELRARLPGLYDVVVHIEPSPSPAPGAAREPDRSKP